MGISGFFIIGFESQHLKHIITSQPPEGFKQPVAEIEILINDKPENPQGDEILVNLKFGYLGMNFHPPTISRLI
jgi:hypothetical protein